MSMFSEFVLLNILLIDVAIALWKEKEMQVNARFRTVVR
jgi:hypothetical protein